MEKNRMFARSICILMLFNVAVCSCGPSGERVLVTNVDGCWLDVNVRTIDGEFVANIRLAPMHSREMFLAVEEDATLVVRVQADHSPTFEQETGYLKGKCLEVSRSTFSRNKCM
jgi:hypothetical protein